MEDLLYTIYNKLKSVRLCASKLLCEDNWPITHTTVRTWLTTDLINMDTENMTVVEISRKLQCSKCWIYTLLKRNNLAYKHINKI